MRSCSHCSSSRRSNVVVLSQQLQRNWRSELKHAQSQDRGCLAGCGPRTPPGVWCPRTTGRGRRGRRGVSSLAMRVASSPEILIRSLELLIRSLELLILALVFPSSSSFCFRCFFTSRWSCFILAPELAALGFNAVFGTPLPVIRFITPHRIEISENIHTHTHTHTHARLYLLPSAIETVWSVYRRSSWFQDGQVDPRNQDRAQTPKQRGKGEGKGDGKLALSCREGGGERRSCGVSLLPLLCVCVCVRVCVTRRHRTERTFLIEKEVKVCVCVRACVVCVRVCVCVCVCVYERC